MTEEIIIDECFNCKKKKDIGDNWRTCKLKCSYKYKRKENDYITRLEQENEALAFRERLYKADYEASEQENKELKEKVKELDKMTGIFSARLCNNYRSALEEIKNDLKEVCKEECDYTKPKFCGDCDCRYGQILNKINEVLNEK